MEVVTQACNDWWEPGPWGGWAHRLMAVQLTGGVANLL